MKNQQMHGMAKKRQLLDQQTHGYGRAPVLEKRLRGDHQY
jgi:hypothetical protein